MCLSFLSHRSRPKSISAFSGSSRGEMLKRPVRRPEQSWAGTRLVLTFSPILEICVMRRPEQRHTTLRKSETKLSQFERNQYEEDMVYHRRFSRFRPHLGRGRTPARREGHGHRAKAG